MITRKYGYEEGGRCSKEVRERYALGVSKATTNERKIFNSRTGFRIGNGRKMKF